VTNFMHITPTAHLDDFAAGRGHHLLLAHLVESDVEYRRWYAEYKAANPGALYILDNSAFEMYKQNRPMYESDKLLSMAEAVGADFIVLSDYPNDAAEKTQNAALELAPKFKDAGFGTFFVPQSRIGNFQEYVDCFEWAVDNRDIDYIGVSILGVPNAFGVERDNKLQRFLSRWRMMHHLAATGSLERLINADRPIGLHFLGMTDGPNEIALVERFIPFIDTWDSSAAVWAGLNGFRFDGSPSGMINGKYEVEVDFGMPARTGLDGAGVELAHINVAYIDNMLEEITSFQE